MGGGCKLSGDSAVVCLGLRALFVRAALVPGELSCEHMELSSAGLETSSHLWVMGWSSALWISLSFPLRKGWRHLPPFITSLETKADGLLQSLEDAWFDTIHNFCQAPAVPLPMGRFGSLSGASPMAPPPRGKAALLLAGVRWWLAKSFPCFHCRLKR